MNYILRVLSGSGLLKTDLDYHFMRATMVFIFAIFGYQKWFAFEAQQIEAFISHNPFVFWLIPVFGLRGASWFLGASEWTFGTLLLLGFWNSRLGMLGALGSIFTFVSTFATIPFMPDGWAAEAGGFPAMKVPIAFLMKDIVLLAASIFLLKQDVIRSAASNFTNRPVRPAVVRAESTL
jgi:uncharacterized membrane protein YkgB